MWIRKTVHGWIRKKVHVYIVFLGGSEVCWISGSNLIWNAQKKLQHQLSELSEDWCWLSALSVGSLMFSPFLLVFHLFYHKFYLVFSNLFVFFVVKAMTLAWQSWQSLRLPRRLDPRFGSTTLQWLRFTPTSHAASTAARFFTKDIAIDIAIYCNLKQFEANCERLRKALSQLFLCVSFISFTVDRRRRKYSRKGSKCPEHPEMLRNIM